MSKSKRQRFERQFEQEMGTRRNYSETKLRVQQLDERRQSMYWQRRRIFDAEFLFHKELPVILRQARGLARFLMEKEIWFENDLLAGSYTFTEYRHSLPFSGQEAFELYAEDLELAGDFDAPLAEELARMFDSCFAGGGSGLHVIGGFERALRLGLAGMRRELEKGEASYGPNDFTRAAILTLDAAGLYFHRIADVAKMLAVRLDTTAERSEKLIAMAKACDWVASEPPETFREALQLVALLHEVITFEERCGSLSFGRFDKYLFPYYDRDVRAGRLTREEAGAMIDAFWLMLADNRWGWQNITLGGYDQAGGFCANEITGMALSASRRLRCDQPQLSFRCHPSMPDWIWREVIELLKLGMGFPSLFNDEQCVASKLRVGVLPEHAEQYAVLGCVELTIPEREYSHTEGLRINWAKMLEVALQGGVCPVTGEYFEPKEPRALDSFMDFDDFFRWFQGEFIHYVEQIARGQDEMHRAFARHFPLPFLSATMEGCAETGRDATAAGTLYNHSCINNVGQANLADSLAAIEKHVFAEKRYTLPELAGMLANNFEGRDDDRRYLYENTPRFGSDQECARLMTEMHELYGAFLTTLPNTRGGVHEAGYYSVEAQVGFGMRTGALPDGRPCGAVLANGMAPVQGTEKHGPLAVLQTVATSVDASYLGNGAALDIKFHPRFFDAPEHTEKFRQVVERYFSLGGMQLQVNVVDRDTLLAAQREPEKYKDLIVRVSGFSAYFGDLSRAVQDEIILRTEF